MGINLRSIRKQRGKTVAELASESGVPAQTIYSIEKGSISEPRLDLLRSLSQAYKIPLPKLTETYYKDQTDKIVQRSILLMQLQGDENLKIGKLVQKALKEEPGENTIQLILKLYELITEKKLLAGRSKKKKR
jgi:transcriptional regulator with XRE-family HTH domain